MLDIGHAKRYLLNDTTKYNFKKDKVYLYKIALLLKYL